MSTESIAAAMEKIQNDFKKKYDEEITELQLTNLINQYGSGRVSEVVNNMKDGAYEPHAFLTRSLKQGWYKGKGKASNNGDSEESKKKGSVEREKTAKYLWEAKAALGWVTELDAEYMIQLSEGNVPRDEKRVKDIMFRLLQEAYPKTPAHWFFWLTPIEARVAANQWIIDNGITNLPLYDY